MSHPGTSDRLILGFGMRERRESGYDLRGNGVGRGDVRSPNHRVRSGAQAADTPGLSDDGANPRPMLPKPLGRK